MSFARTEPGAGGVRAARGRARRPAAETAAKPSRGPARHQRQSVDQPDVRGRDQCGCCWRVAVGRPHVSADRDRGCAAGGSCSGVRVRLFARHEPAAREPCVPGCGLPARPDSAGAAATQALESTSLKVPVRLAVRSRHPPVIDGLRADVVVGFGGYVSMPVYVAARRTKTSARGSRGQRPARPREPVRRARVQRLWRPPSRTRSCRTRATSVCRSAEPSRPSTATTCGRWRASTSAWPRYSDVCCHGWVAGSEADQPVGVGLRGRASPRPVFRCCT